MLEYIEYIPRTLGQGLNFYTLIVDRYIVLYESYLEVDLV